MVDTLDLLNLEPSKIDRTLKGKFVLIYGAPKTGKSTFASKTSKALFLKFEEGTNALGGIRGVPMVKWTDLKKVLKQLRDPRVKEMYDTIVVDTASIAYQLCENFILTREGVENIRDIPWGSGFSMVKREFTETWREIALLGYGIIFIAHEKTYATGVFDSNGEEIQGVKPDLTNAAANIINAQVDIIAYLDAKLMADGTVDRKLYTRATPTVFAGNRYKYLAPVIPFGDNGYDELVNAIGDAIDKDAATNGVMVTDVHETVVATRKPFSEVMSRAKELWMGYINGASSDEEMENRANLLNDHVAKIFGKPIKVSTVLPSQQDLLEMLVEEMEEIVKL